MLHTSKKKPKTKTNLKKTAKNLPIRLRSSLIFFFTIKTIKPLLLKVHIPVVSTSKDFVTQGLKSLKINIKVQNLM